MNALLLPIVLGFLLVLERKALPPEHRMRGAYRFTCTALCLICIGFGLYMVPAGSPPGVSGSGRDVSRGLRLSLGLGLSQQGLPGGRGERVGAGGAGDELAPQRGADQGGQGRRDTW